MSAGDAVSRLQPSAARLRLWLLGGHGFRIACTRALLRSRLPSVTSKRRSADGNRCPPAM